MKRKTTHEPKAKLMSAADVWDDAQQIASVLRRNAKSEPVVRLQIPLSVFLSALDSLDRDELAILRDRVQQQLAA
jgi:hypothetical protein